MIRRAVPILLVLFLSSSAFAWSKAGHMVVGAIAYDDLKANHPKTLDKLLAILAQHPGPKPFKAKINAMEPQNKDRYLVMLAARWPDDIRDDKEVHHGPWHYIDFPIKAPGDPTPTEPPDKENALTAMAAQAAVLKNKSAKPGDRAIAACWVEHIIGDVHQPMHAVSMFNADLPKGDRGGNLTFVQLDPTKGTINLHALWDSVVTGTEKYQDAADIATELRLRPEFRRDALPELKSKDPNDWVKESADVAFKVAYLNGTLKGGTKTKGTLLPSDYGKTAKAAAERRTVLAGYRLSDALVLMLGE